MLNFVCHLNDGPVASAPVYCVATVSYDIVLDHNNNYNNEKFTTESFKSLICYSFAVNVSGYQLNPLL